MPPIPERADLAPIRVHITSWPVFPDLETDISINLNTEIIALTGRNGTGKTRFVRLINGLETWPGAEVNSRASIATLPQTSIPPSNCSVAAHLEVSIPLEALQALNSGSGNVQDLIVLNDRWNLRDEIDSAMNLVGLSEVDLDRSVESLSGGEFTRLELVRLQLSGADFLILDEPTNHLDSRAQAYVLDFIDAWPAGMLVVSHDRRVLRKANRVLELSALGLSNYGGNYDLYIEHRELEHQAAIHNVAATNKQVNNVNRSAQIAKEKAARRASSTTRMRSSPGGNKSLSSGSHSKMVLDGWQRSAQNSAGQRTRKAEVVLDRAEDKLKSLTEKLEFYRTLDFHLPSANTRTGQTLVRLENYNFSFDVDKKILIDELSFVLKGKEKVAITGINGSGKSTLLKLIDGQIIPGGKGTGRLTVSDIKVAYLDQKTEILEGADTIFDAFRLVNCEAKPRETHAALARFLFRADDAFKKIRHLSGGERIRCALAALLFSPQPPQLLLLDEPNNHLDLDSQFAIARALNTYDGGLLIVSHDEEFLENAGVNKFIKLGEEVR